ncbi:MAG: hypothetical protein AAB455_02780 [Patescibacteria group bacterium]
MTELGAPKGTMRFLKPKGELRRLQERIEALEEVGDRIKWLRNINTECGDHKSEAELVFEQALIRAFEEWLRMGRLCGMVVEK